MAFYDKEIKRVCESCPRLLILLINSVFSKCLLLIIHSLRHIINYKVLKPGNAEKSAVKGLRHIINYKVLKQVLGFEESYNV